MPRKAPKTRLLYIGSSAEPRRSGPFSDERIVGLLNARFVPSLVPARVISQRFLRRATNGDYVDESTMLKLHIDQTSKDNAKRLMSVVCPKAAVIWWSGSTRKNQRGALMAYLPTPDGHKGWYAEFKKVDDWKLAQTLCTTAGELSSYATSIAS